MTQRYIFHKIYKIAKNKTYESSYFPPPIISKFDDFLACSI